MDDGWKTAADPFTYHSPLCNLTTKQGLQVCSCKPMIYDEKFADAFFGAFMKWADEQEVISMGKKKGGRKC